MDAEPLIAPLLPAAFPAPIVRGSLIRELPAHDRPRERLVREGGTALTDTELLAVLLRTGCAGVSALDLARELLTISGGIAGLATFDAGALRRRGLGAAKSASLLAALELARRVARAELPDRLPLGNPEAVGRYLLLRYAERDQEVMGALFLDIRNRLIGEAELYRGTMVRASVEPRAFLKQALLRSAAGLLLFHTHPSGDPSPSAEDLAFTRRLADAGDLLGIRLLDHVVLGGGRRWVSLRRRGGW
ncbi:MAG TPA: DNA repair protein RadC [Thermoanaerobaculia bacterium]|nr:DNA repair protein RadC [Thermoanaerobaculia bacterium]